MSAHIPASRRRVLTGLILVSLWLQPTNLAAQQADSLSTETLRNAIDVCPLSPAFKIYAIDYTYRITPHSEIILGPYYGNIHYEDIGNTNAPGFIVGYRQYLWKSLHIDYQLIPQWDHFYEKNEDKRYPLGFDLWNEFRLGYIWDFRIGTVPAYINFQWPFGFALYSDGSAKPESFKQHARDHPIFDFPPMFFVGIRF